MNIMYIALDIGGTTTRVATCASLEHITVEHKKTFRNTANFFMDYATLVKTIDELTHEKIHGISIGIAGQIDKKTSEILLDAPNLPDWNHKPLVEKLREKYACPVFMHNDSITGSFGEAIFGKYNAKEFIYFIWGTGIGGAKVSLENDIVQTHQLLPWAEYFFDFEKDCGGGNIIKKYGKRSNDLEEKEWEKVIHYFVYHLQNLLKKEPTSLIVLSGGVALNNKNRVEEINSQIRKKVPVSLVVSHLGEDANLLGAFYLLKKHI